MVKTVVLNSGKKRGVKLFDGTVVKTGVELFHGTVVKTVVLSIASF